MQKIRIQTSIGRNTFMDFFSIVLLCEVNNREYTFRTQTIDGNDPCKSPRGMFEELNIPNDLLIVKNKINEYYEEV